MYVMRPLIGVDRLKIGRMAHDMEPLCDSIAPMHVATHARVSKALPQLLRFIRLMSSGLAVPSSII